MKRLSTLLCLATLIGPPLAAHAQQTPTASKASSRISVQLKNVPFKSALDTLFKSTGYPYQVEPEVTNAPITLQLMEVDFDEALRLLIKCAGEVQRDVYVQKQNGMYVIGVQTRTPHPEPQRVSRIPVEFQNAADLVRQMERLGATDGDVTVQASSIDNAILVKSTAKELKKVVDVISLLDVPAQMLSVRIGVTGPGTGARPFQLGSMSRTLNGKEVVIDEQTTSGGELARLRVQVRPVVQGDGGVLAESDWDLSIPVGGGPKGPIRLVKRLTTTARLRSGRSITVGEVDLAPFGGAGTVRLWLRADLISKSEWTPASTGAGEPISTVQVSNGKPYLSAYWLASALGGQLRRGAGGQYEIRPGLSKDSERLPKAEQPSQSGPFRLKQGALVISESLQFNELSSEDRQLIPDVDGEPIIPLEDLARILGGRLQYDSAEDSYRIVGGSSLRALRFPRSGE